MAVKALILDLDGTLVGRNGNAVPGVPEMLDELRRVGLRLAVASNRPGASAKLRQAALSADLLLTRQSVGASKGSPLWVKVACDAFGIQANELLWVGDSDMDMRSAVNARVVYFNAGWSTPDYPYGITIQWPFIVPIIVRECFMKPVNWYWELSTTDGRGHKVTTKAMIDGSGAGIGALKFDLISFLKEGGNPRVGLLRVRDLIMLHLLGSIYGDGLYLDADVWTVYPGSRDGPNEAMSPFVNRAAQLFRDRYAGALLIRHRPSVDSGTARREQRQVDFLNQVNTVHLDAEWRGKIEGKRILMVDDFVTRGFSSECARNLLLQAGALEVVCVGIGKYGPSQHILTARAGLAWDPFVPTRHSPTDFHDREVEGMTNHAALQVVRDSYNRVARARRGSGAP